MSKRIVNFSAGPAAIPLTVLEKAASELTNFNQTGMSIMEMSHRSAAYDAVHTQAKEAIKELLAIPDTHSVLFMQGGASHQFAMLPLNFAKKNAPVHVIHTGEWTKKAIGELKKGYHYQIIASGEKSTFKTLPDITRLAKKSDAAYTYMCSNNTIYGTQFKTFPTQINAPLVVDMSSDILSRQLNISDFGIIFAGAQKNIGPSGVTLVIIRNDLLNQCSPTIPNFFSYNVHQAADSMYNTPPTFSVYMASLVFQYLLDQGGLEKQAKKNEDKAALLYHSIDNSDVFYCPISESDRSLMNVVFRHKDHDETYEKTFIKAATTAGFDGIKGHRSVGGLRASIYNAQPIENIQRFINFMNQFTKQTAASMANA